MSSICYTGGPSIVRNAIAAGLLVPALFSVAAWAQDPAPSDKRETFQREHGCDVNSHRMHRFVDVLFGIFCAQSDRLFE